MTKTVAGKTWEILVFDWLVAGSHWETGEPTEELIYFLVAEDAEGNRFKHGHTFDRVEDAERLVARVCATSDWVGPEVSRYWKADRPAYGSEAYARNWRRYEAETELAEREAELGPDAFASLPLEMQLVLH